MVLNRKVTTGAFAGAITAIAVWAAREFAGVQIPGEIASAITVVVIGLTSYMVPEKRQESPK